MVHSRSLLAFRAWVSWRWSDRSRSIRNGWACKRLGLPNRKGDASGSGGKSEALKREVLKKKRSGSDSDSSQSSWSSSSCSDRSRQEKKRRRTVVKWLSTDLMTVAAEEPGALAALFLTAARFALRGGPPSSARDLLKGGVERWARGCAGLTERRDQREIRALMMVMAKLGDGEYALAADVVAQRAMRLLFAWCAKGSC